ncbi:MAG: DUF2769 domain-containing protein [Candidatus Bathyarchaeota archaeon]|nr:MAG: DUF2769 domain-containing protein [Candidatus Bathyarchaeota archaeon]
MKEVEDNPQNEETCKDFCGSCPSYPGTEEWLFCAQDKSQKEIRRSGCLCPSCQVYMDYELSGDYFCAEGAPK